MNFGLAVAWFVMSRRRISLMFSGRTTTSISAPAAAPVDFNAGKPTFGELAPLFWTGLCSHFCRLLLEAD